MSPRMPDYDALRAQEARAREAANDREGRALVQAIHERKARTMADNPHFVKVEPSAPDADGWRDMPTVTFECRGDRTSTCHQYPDCDCEWWDDTHEHPLVPHDECWMEGWFDNDGHSYEGPDSNDMDEGGVPRELAASGQIEAHYEDGYVSWDFAA